tara:strand:+ start:1416 stop:2021 length:606 start_codon:yes stop_codon:yes gene_type:complete
MYDGKNNVLYPIFIDCMKYTSDIFWKNTFEELSYGRCPYGIYMSNDNLCCNYKDKKFCYNIHSETDSEIVYNDIIDLFRNKFGLLSKNDKLMKNKLFVVKQEEINNILNNEWNNIKRKNIRLMLIEKFVIQKSNEYSLDISNSKLLYNNIILGLLFKTIHKNSIIYENQNIKEIKCISFKKNNFTFNKDLYNFKNELIFID